MKGGVYRMLTEKGTYPEVKGTYPEVIENPSGEKGNPQRDNGRNSIPPPKE